MVPPEMAMDCASDAAGNTPHEVVVVIGPDLNCSRSPLDKKLYRHITLPNGLQAVLIQDTIAMQQQKQSGNTSYGPDADDESDSEDDEINQDDEDDGSEDEEDDAGGLRDAACCILVGAGSASDPASCPGLAHFLEHLLFMGSEKYPVENEYESYVSRQGGSDNAWTEWEYTAYTLQIPVSALWGAVDRLAQFFVEPLLLPSAVERELKSIDSEFLLNKNDDSCRQQQLRCSCSDPRHPMANFSWGNMKSLKDIPAVLGVDPMKELRDFYNMHYYAENMRLVIQGAYSLDELQEGVFKYFSKVPAHPRDSSPPNFQLTAVKGAGFPLLPITQGTVTRIVPIRERHSLHISWQIPSQFSHWKSKPVDFISHLLGHEASGSILSYAREMSWASGCMAGCGDEGSENATSHAFMSISFTLLEAGLKHWKELVEVVYHYIGMLRQQCRSGWPVWIHEELRRIYELSYRYGDEKPADEIVESLVEDMAPHLQLPTERLLDGSSLLFEFDEITVQSLLDDYLTPEKARIELTSSTFGKPSDFVHVAVDKCSTETLVSNLIIKNESMDGSFDVVSAGIPQIDPMFGTQFWCHRLPQLWVDRLTEVSQAGSPTIDMLRLPPCNPFVPHNFNLKQFPDDDAEHPLLNASLKLCIPVGKTKLWFPATVVRFNQEKNNVLLSFEDENENWHTLDHSISEFTHEFMLRFDTFEGTMDSKMIKYRVVALSLHPGAKGAGIRKFGDESDLDVEEGTSFPPIPPPSSRLPVQIANTNALKMWWLQDRRFKRPIAELRLQLICAQANASPLHRAMADLLQSLCADALLETSYLAEMCQLGSSIEATDIGFNLRFHGFDEKLLDLFQATMSLLLSFRNVTDSLPEAINDDRFAPCLEVLLRSYRNSGMTAAGLSSSIRLQTMRPTIFSANKKLKALQGTNIGIFCQVVSSILNCVAVEALFHGNVDRYDANKTKDLILDMLNVNGGSALSRKKYPAQSVLRMPSVVDNPNLIVVPSKDPEELNTACEVYVQVGKDNLRDRVLMDLLIHMMEEPIYDQIRTKDQFGYDVHCDIRWSYGIIGCVFHVTTNTRSARAVIDRLDKFLIDFRHDLVEMNKVEYNEHVVGLAKQKLDSFNSLSEETGCLWGEIHDGRFEWEAWRNETICLKNISKEDAIKAFDAWLRPGHCRRIVVVQVIGSGDSEASHGRPAVDVEGFGDFVDHQVESFHKLCKKQTWGRVNSKLF